MKIVCIYHSKDLDGWMSAAIVKHWFNSKLSENIVFANENSLIEYIAPVTGINDIQKNSLDFIGYNYGEKIPDLSSYDSVIMCDISFPKEEMSKLWDKVGVDNMIWIDHHISAIKDIQDTKWLWEGMQDTKYAACELTWRYYFPNEKMPEIVRLLGMYDSFRHKETEEEQKVLEFQFGARKFISNHNEAYFYLLESLKNNTTFQNEGKIILEYLKKEAKEIYKNGFDIEFDIVDETIKAMEGHNNNRIKYKFICFNKERFNPINFGIDYHKDGYDGAACFHYANGKWSFSLYNDNVLVDCSLIAKEFGGGGHKGAAGFIIKDINEILKNRN